MTVHLVVFEHADLCANRNSDGWAYWPKPFRAAARLMEPVEGDGMLIRNGPSCELVEPEAETPQPVAQ